MVLRVVQLFVEAIASSEVLIPSVRASMKTNGDMSACHGVHVLESVCSTRDVAALGVVLRNEFVVPYGSTVPTSTPVAMRIAEQSSYRFNACFKHACHGLMHLSARRPRWRSRAEVGGLTMMSVLCVIGCGRWLSSQAVCRLSH